MGIKEMLKIMKFFYDPTKNKYYDKSLYNEEIIWDELFDSLQSKLTGIGEDELKEYHLVNVHNHYMIEFGKKANETENFVLIIKATDGVGFEKRQIFHSIEVAWIKYKDESVIFHYCDTVSDAMNKKSSYVITPFVTYFDAKNILGLDEHYAFRNIDISKDITYFYNRFDSTAFWQEVNEKVSQRFMYVNKKGMIEYVDPNEYELYDTPVYGIYSFKKRDDNNIFFDLIITIDQVSGMIDVAVERELFEGQVVQATQSFQTVYAATRLNG